MVQIRPAFGGNIMAQILITDSRPQFATVRYRVMDRAKKVEACAGVIEDMEISDGMRQSGIRILSSQVIEHQKSIEEEDILVVAGRGVKSERDVEMCRKLAELWEDSLPLPDLWWKRDMGTRSTRSDFPAVRYVPS